MRLINCCVRISGDVCCVFWGVMVILIEIVGLVIYSFI